MEPQDYLTHIEHVEPQLIELDLGAGQGSGIQSAIALADVRFSRARLVYDAYTIYASITHAEIHVSAIPPVARIRDRLGDDPAISTESTEYVSERSRLSSRSAAASAAAQVGPQPAVALSASAAGKATSSQSDSAKRTSIVPNPILRARGDGIWAVASFDSAIPLEGRVVRNDELCSIDCGSAITEISVSIQVPKQNIVVERVTDNHSGKTLKIDKGRAVLLRMLVARKLGVSGDAIVMAIGRLTPR